MTRLRCACGLILYPGRPSCPECGRPMSMAQDSNESVPTAEERDKLKKAKVK